MEPSPYSGDGFAEVDVAMGADCSVNSHKPLDKFTVPPINRLHNRASFGASRFPAHEIHQEYCQMHGTEDPSLWVQRWSHLAKPQSQVLDLACGAGRHMKYFQSLGHHCTGVDRSSEALAQAGAFGQVIEADIEGGPWPLSGQTFDVVVVTNYLWRPLMPRILACLAAEGLLIYETFALGHEKIGKPSRPDFLLQPGELLQTCASLRVIAYQDGFWDSPAKFVQRIVAVHQVNDLARPFCLSSR
jgi:SAM-dependent methyltransferase